MAHRRDHSEEEEDDWEDDADHYDPDEPETYPQGLYDDDGPPTVACPHCGAEILEDSEQCPRCETFLSREDAPSAGKSAAWWILILLALAAAAVMVVG
ncbi:MAG TPA: hypothetical protein VLM40_18040 [Gemmata sp.]|nr:hypothetical protein [Gemmata sp.]